HHGGHAPSLYVARKLKPNRSRKLIACCWYSSLMLQVIFPPFAACAAVGFALVPARYRRKIPPQRFRCDGRVKKKAKILPTCRECARRSPNHLPPRTHQLESNPLAWLQLRRQ